MNRPKLKPPPPPEGPVPDGLPAGGEVRGAAGVAAARGCGDRPVAAAPFPLGGPPLPDPRLLPALLGVAVAPPPPVPPRGPPVGDDRVTAGGADSRNSKKSMLSPPCNASVPPNIRTYRGRSIDEQASTRPCDTVRSTVMAPMAPRGGRGRLRSLRGHRRMWTQLTILVRRPAGTPSRAAQSRPRPVLGDDGVEGLAHWPCPVRPEPLLRFARPAAQSTVQGCTVWCAASWNQAIL